MTLSKDGWTASDDERGGESDLVQSTPVSHAPNPEPKSEIVIAEDLRERHEKLSKQLRGSRAQQRYAQFTHELIERLSRAEQELAALRTRLEQATAKIPCWKCRKMISPCEVAEHIGHNADSSTARKGE